MRIVASGTMQTSAIDAVHCFGHVVTAASLAVGTAWRGAYEAKKDGRPEFVRNFADAAALLTQATSLIAAATRMVADIVNAAEIPVATAVVTAADASVENATKLATSSCALLSLASASEHALAKGSPSARAIPVLPPFYLDSETVAPSAPPLGVDGLTRAECAHDITTAAQKLRHCVTNHSEAFHSWQKAVSEVVQLQIDVQCAQSAIIRAEVLHACVDPSCKNNAAADVDAAKKAHALAEEKFEHAQSNAGQARLNLDQATVRYDEASRIFEACREVQHQVASTMYRHFCPEEA